CRAVDARQVIPFQRLPQSRSGARDVVADLRLDEALEELAERLFFERAVLREGREIAADVRVRRARHKISSHSLVGRRPRRSRSKSTSLVRTCMHFALPSTATFSPDTRRSSSITPGL